MEKKNFEFLEPYQHQFSDLDNKLTHMHTLAHAIPLDNEQQGEPQKTER